MANSLLLQVRNAPFQKLQELYNSVYPTPLQDVIGPELTKDIRALADLRNLFAHGRQLIIDFEPRDPEISKTDLSKLDAYLEKNILAKAYLRLGTCGIEIPDQVTFKNYHTWLLIIYSDQAIRHFFESSRRLEAKLRSANCFAGESSVIHIHPLPVLP